MQVDYFGQYFATLKIFDTVTARIGVIVAKDEETARAMVSGSIDEELNGWFTS